MNSKKYRYCFSLALPFIIDVVCCLVADVGAVDADQATFIKFITIRDSDILRLTALFIYLRLLILIFIY